MAGVTADGSSSGLASRPTTARGASAVPHPTGRPRLDMSCPPAGERITGTTPSRRADVRWHSTISP